MEKERPSKQSIVHQRHGEFSLYDHLWEDGYVLQSALFETEPRFIPTIGVLIDTGAVIQEKVITDNGTEDYILRLRDERKNA